MVPNCNNSDAALWVFQLPALELTLYKKNGSEVIARHYSPMCLTSVYITRHDKIFYWRWQGSCLSWMGRVLLSLFIWGLQGMLDQNPVCSEQTLWVHWVWCARLLVWNQMEEMAGCSSLIEVRWLRSEWKLRIPWFILMLRVEFWYLLATALLEQLSYYRMLPLGVW